VRHNSQDEEIRRLERRAAHGDTDAVRRLRQLRRRVSPRVSKWRKFATWDEIADEIWPEKDRRGRSTLGFVRMDDFPPSWITDTAWEYAAGWIKEYEKDNKVKLTDEQKSAVDSQFQWALEKHWTAEALLKNRLGELFGPINDWAGQPIEERLDWYYHPPKIGTAIEWGKARDPEKGSGIWFKVRRPIIRVFQEARRDERTLSTIDIWDVVALAREIWELQRSRDFMELPYRYEDQWDQPDNKEIVKEILEAGPLMPAPDEDEEDEDQDNDWY
jgi:hypothetical protein